MPHRWTRAFSGLIVAGLVIGATTGSTADRAPRWALDNPIVPLPKPPLGTRVDFSRIAWVTPERVRLGRWLFFDPRLSYDGTISCASCHQPARAFSDGRAVSIGVRGHRGARKSPTFVNEVWQHRAEYAYFWDGRASTLAQQATQPIVSKGEMASTPERAVERVGAVAAYRSAFDGIYGDGVITLARIGEAIAAYEATRLSGNSAVDRFETGDAGALSAAARRGRALFGGKAGCRGCHFDWTYAGSGFENLGVGWAPRVSGVASLRDGFADLGRGGVTGLEEDIGAFKTPTLRDVSKHAPYMHDGSLRTLRAVVEFYNAGGRANPGLSDRLKPLGLAVQEIDDLVAFLRALDGEGYADPGPALLPP